METRFTVAAVQTAPHFLDLPRTIAKTCACIREAAAHGASVVAFPEAFIPAYPYWAWLESPLQSQKRFQTLYRSSLTIPGDESEELGRCARENDVVVVVGVNEIDPRHNGTIFATNLVLGSDGNVLGRHRKLVPTYAEKLVWGPGDGSGYQVYHTPFGRIGTLPCGENTNTLARFALLAQGEQVHVANFPAFPFTEWYGEVEAIRIRCRAHAFEGKVFVIASTSLLDAAGMAGLLPAEHLALLRGKAYALSGIYGPDGMPLAELIDDEGIVYAEIDLDDLVRPKLMHDITGHYNQFAVLSLNLNRSAQRPLHDSGSLLLEDPL